MLDYCTPAPISKEAGKRFRTKMFSEQCGARIVGA